MSDSTPLARLAALPALKEVIAHEGLAADKRLGQHFLLDPAILERIVRAAGVQAGDAVLEVGPGPGGLTRALLGAGAQVTAIERDPRCIAALASLVTAADGGLRLVQADALTLAPAELMGQAPFAIVANLPYNIGTELLVRWLLNPMSIRAIHVMLQKEVVDRLVASPGGKAYGRLSVLAQLTCEVGRCFDLPAGAFQPPPKVTSTLVALRPRATAPRGELLTALQRLTHTVFQQRRKMLRTSLKSLGGEALLAGTGIGADRRPETLSPATFLELAQRLLAVGP